MLPAAATKSQSKQQALTSPHVSMCIFRIEAFFPHHGGRSQTLAKTIYIHNNGDALSDFTVRTAPAIQQVLDLQPAVNHALLHTDSGVYVKVAPILYLEFQSLKAEVEASAAGQTGRFPVEFQAPPGVRLMAFRSATTLLGFAFGRICTNHPNTCSVLPGTPGNPSL